MAPTTTLTATTSTANTTKSKTCNCKCKCSNTAESGKDYCSSCAVHYDFAW